jgi:hypothetical protein
LFRKILLSIVGMVLLGLPTQAQVATPAATSSAFGRFTHYVGRHIKETFTDMRKDRLWGVAVAGNWVLEGLDEGTTIYGVHHGLIETNWLYGKRPSAPKIIGFGSVFTLAQLTTTHMIREDFTNICHRDADNPNSLWNSGKIAAGSYRWQTCQYGGDAVAIVVWAPRAEDVAGNFCVLKNACILKPAPTTSASK